MAAAISRSFLSDLDPLAPFRSAAAKWAFQSEAQAEGGEARPVLATRWAELDAVLPDHGFVHGATELAAPFAHGGGSSIAMASIASLHAASSASGRAWAAWVDPEGSLYAPALAEAGVDLSHLLVVRPPPNEARQVAVKLAASAAFAVVVVDHFAAASLGRGVHKADELFVRKLSLQPCVSLLLTDQHAPRTGSLPTVLRLELSRRPDAITVRVAKDRMGRAGAMKTVPLRTRPSLTASSSSQSASLIVAA